MRPILIAAFCALLCALPLALGGCSSLRQALGVEPSSSAPTVYNVNMASAPSSTPTVDANADQSGGVGATAEGTLEGRLAQSVAVDPEAVAAGVLELAKVVQPESQAAELLADAQRYLARGQVERAKVRLEDAREAAKDPPPPAE